MPKKVIVPIDGEDQTFKTEKKNGALRILTNEGLFTSEFVEAVRKLRRWPRKGEELGENGAGTPCFYKDGKPVRS